MKRYKFITIGPIPNHEINKRPVYAVTNNKSGARLAIIYYYPSWRQFVAEFESGCLFNKDCLTDIIDFLTNHAGKVS